MRAAIITAALILALGVSSASAQGRRGWQSVYRPAPQVHSHGQNYGHRHFDGHDHFGHHHSGLPPYLSGYGGFGYGYGVSGLGVYGSGLSYYRGPAAFSGITPPVYVYPPVGYGYGFGYGYGLPDRYGDTGYYLGFGPTYGYGTSYAPGGQLPYNGSLQQYRYENDWARLSAELADRAMRNVDEPRAGTSTVPTPSTPEARIRSARYVAKGDEAFANQEYAKALGHYKTATGIARDDGATFLKLGYAYVALGRFQPAIEAFRRALAVDPAVAAIGPTPDEMYGEQKIAWTTHLGRVTRWVAEDVRDSQRVFLLATLLAFDGDTRAPEFLEKAWQLSGGTESAIVSLLNPPKVETVEVGKPEAAPAESDDSDATPAEGPLLRSAEPPHDAGTVELPTIPEPPATARPLTGRPYGQEPLFPLPSEQNQSVDEPVPPLPVE